MIRPGDTASRAFIIDEQAMQTFLLLSGDASRIHTDDAFARACGYRGVIVYGALLLTQLSHVLGQMLPGPHGISMRWTIDYRTPLYVGEQAELVFETVFVSEATGVVEAKFRISADGRTIATGTTQSLIPPISSDSAGRA